MLTASCRNLGEVDLNVDHFLKDLESIMKHQGFEDAGNKVDKEEGSSSDFDLGKLYTIFFH